MTQIDGRPVGDAEHMPARWYSIQWLSVRIAWGLFAAGFICWRVKDPTDTGMTIAALVIGVIVFAGLTFVAHRDRRIWAREHAED